MKYEVEGLIKIKDVFVEVEADSEEEAKKKAIELFNDSYKLDYIGNRHDPKNVEFELYAYEEEAK